MSLKDASTIHLLNQVRANATTLWLADENIGDMWRALAGNASQLTVLSNRFDVARTAQDHGIRAVFNDWMFADIGAPYDNVILRICKEKTVNIHLIREAHRALRTGGNLLLAGEKNEGIKSIWDFAFTLFDDTNKLKKNGTVYSGILEKSEREKPEAGISEGEISEGEISEGGMSEGGMSEGGMSEGEKSDGSRPTETAAYHAVQIIADWDGKPIFSKPGVYGWDKIDVGSALFIETLRTEKSIWQSATSVLDLGCGYGFLTLASDWLPCQRRVATDNNAAALICTAKNAAERNLPVETVAADKGDLVKETFDLVLCNPPFHRGFDVDRDLTRDFLLAAKAKLTRDGTAVFVVNSFIALEKKAQGIFGNMQLLADTRQFKVVAFGR